MDKNPIRPISGDDLHACLVVRFVCFFFPLAASTSYEKVSSQ
jgi:hypothetical protein